MIGQLLFVLSPCWQWGPVLTWPLWLCWSTPLHILHSWSGRDGKHLLGTSGALLQSLWSIFCKHDQSQSWFPLAKQLHNLYKQLCLQLWWIPDQTLGCHTLSRWGRKDARCWTEPWWLCQLWTLNIYHIGQQTEFGSHAGNIFCPQTQKILHPRLAFELNPQKFSTQTIKIIWSEKQSWISFNSNPEMAGNIEHKQSIWCGKDFHWSSSILSSDPEALCRTDSVWWPHWTGKSPMIPPPPIL